MPKEHENNLNTLIRTKDQPWLNSIRMCVTDNDADRLSALTTWDDIDYRTLTKGLEDDADDEIDDEFSGWSAMPAPGRAARGVVALAQAVLGSGEHGRLLSEALKIFETNDIACAQDLDSVSSWKQNRYSRGKGAVSSVLNLLNEIDSPAVGFAYLLTRFLTGDFPRRADRPVQLPVLLEVQNPSLRDASEPGIGAILQLERLSEGPPGIYADPRTMTFAQCDQQFANALNSAWKGCKLYGTEACLVWSLFVDEAVVDRVNGGSMGAAFAVGLDEWAPRGGIAQLLRRASLDPSCAITGQLDGPRILPVTGYDSKLWAAARQRWRVVVPRKSKEEIEAVRDRVPDYAKLNVRYVDSVSQAVRKSRRMFGRTALAMVAVIVLCIALLSGLSGMLDGVRLRTKSTELASISLSERSSDPRISALTALLAYRMNPSTDSARAARGVAETYPGVVGAVKAYDSQVAQVTHVGDFLLSADSSGNVSLWKNRVQVGSSLELGAKVISLKGAVDGTLAVALLGSDLVFINVFDEGRLTESARVSVNGGTASSVLSPAISISTSADGLEVRLIYKTGLVARYSRYGHLIGNIDLGELLGRGGDSDPTRITAASPFMGGYIPDETCDGDCLLLGTDKGDVYLYDPEVGSSKLLFKIPETPEGLEITSLSCDDTVIVAGTASGVRVWEQASSEMNNLPLPGVNLTVHDVVVSGDGQIAVLVGGVFAPTTALYFETGERSAVTQRISGTAIGTTNGLRGITVGTSGGMFVFVDRQRDRSAQRIAATTALAVTSEGNVVQTSGYSPMSITDLRVLGLDDTVPAGYSVVQELAGPEGWQQKGWYVNDIDVNGHLVAASGLAPSGSTGSIVVWDRRTSDVVSVVTSSLDSSVRDGDDPPIVSMVRFLGDSGLIAGYSFSSGDLFILGAGGRSGAVDYNLISRRHLGGGLGSMAYCGVNDMLYVLVWPERDYSKADHEIVAIDAVSGITRWTVPVGNAVRMTVNPITGNVAASDGSILTVYSGVDGSVIRKGELPAPADMIMWSPDGSSIAVAEAGGNLDIVDSVSMVQRMPTMRVGERLDFSRVLWMPDSKKVVVSTVSQDSGGGPTAGYTFVVRADGADWTDRMCEIAGSNLSPNEWKEYVGDEFLYEKVCPA